MAKYDVIVLGGGSAGTSAAAAASRCGARTLVINDGELGGLCILRGCMPTKAMLASADLLHEFSRAESLGIRWSGAAHADFRAIMGRKQAQVLRFQRAKIRGVESQDYDVLFGSARFAAGGRVAVDGRELAARSYVIATGSRARRLPVPGLEGVRVLTSDDVMALTEQPRALIVLGAGPIGLELAQFFARIGTRVLLVNRSPLLARSDAECGAELERALQQEERLQLCVPGSIEALRPTASGLVASVAGKDRSIRFDADALLMATGREAALDDLELEHVGLTAVDGRLECDDHMRTANPEVYVAGDATGRFQVLHEANHEGTVAGHNAAGATPPKIVDRRFRMSVIFTDPPFARVGLTESEARSRGSDPVVGRASFPETGRAITMGVEHGLWKLVADRSSGELLGSTILGPRADDLIHEIALMMHYRGSFDEICRLPWYHPTLSEVMLNLAREIADQLDRTGEGILPPGAVAGAEGGD